VTLGLCVCVCVRRAATACRISLGGEGNALYPLSSALWFVFFRHWYCEPFIKFLFFKRLILSRPILLIEYGIYAKFQTVNQVVSIRVKVSAR